MRVALPISAHLTWACACAVLFLSVFVVASTRGGLTNEPHSRKAFSAKSRELNEDACVPLLQPHIQKVALMFLVRGEVYHEAVWTQWLVDIAGIVPSSVACDEELSKCYKGLQERSSPPRSPYDEQSFYSIVVHPKPDFPGYSRGSIFDGRIVEERTKWGTHSLVMATKILMRAALEDPFAQRFQLVCEATIPLRSGLFGHSQLLAMNKSRVGSNEGMFNTPEDGTYRWPLAMHEEWRELYKYTKFHRQWVTLIREHAQLVADDNFLANLFERHCSQSIERHKPHCVSDEQYIGTLLSWKLGDQIKYGYTNDMALALLQPGVGISPEDIDTEFITQARGSSANISRLHGFQDHIGECHAAERPAAEYSQFGDGYSEHRTCTESMRQPPLYDPSQQFPYCYIFARKFNAHTTKVVQRVLQRLFII